jgi:uncharacterized protein with HEPN domain
MSSPRRDRDYLGDIVEAAERVLSYASGLNFESFLDDRRTQDAILRNLQVIGEAAKKISPSLRAAHPHLPWREMTGLRNRIVHDYFGVDLEVVWVIVEDELPGLLRDIEAILRSEDA